MGRIIDLDRSVIPACDVDYIPHLSKLVNGTKDVKFIKAYKIGFDLVLEYGLAFVVNSIKEDYPEAVVIYDHQKGGTDIPDMGKKFARKMKGAKVDAAILFPMSGPVTQKAWTDALFEKDVMVIIGGEMTHEGYKRSDDGYIDDDALEEMYLRGAYEGVNDFVVPGNKPDSIKKYYDVLREECGIYPTFYAPGFIDQGGRITDAGKVAGPRWHAIVGRGIYNPNGKGDLIEVTTDEIHEAAIRLTKQLYGSD